ncbi:phospholipid/cholesterol/gamma-HCH transport system substrate-binding protein [Rhodococcus erythropolis]|nr:phospholipid/cholesterol/gamma-HCH transport system substrate-binding protein [Rhodococcus erythropolis]
MRKSLMTPTRERNPVQIGVIGLVLAVATVGAALQYDQLQFINGGIRYSAYFQDAGGLVTGDDVTMAGVKVGKVSDVELDDQKVLVTFTVQDGVALGEQTAADIKTNTVLGRKSLAVRPEGSGLLRTDTPIPIERTNSPYSLNDALGDLGTTVSELDTEQINDSLNAISDTLADTPPELRTALDGMTRLSQSINSRDESLLQLLSRAEDVTKILSDRSGQIDSLLVDGNKLFAELSLRRDAISELIVNTGAVSRQLSALVQENEAQMGPTLEKLNSVAEVLQQNKDNIAGALDGLGPYITALGETVASGPFFDAFIINILPSNWWKTLVDTSVAPEQVPGDLEDFFPGIPPTIRGPGE